MGGDSLSLGAMHVPGRLAFAVSVMMALGSLEVFAQEANPSELLVRSYYAPHPYFPNPLLDKVVIDPEIIFEKNEVIFPENGGAVFKENGEMVVKTTAYQHRVVRAVFHWQRERMRRDQVADIKAIDATEEILNTVILSQVSFMETPFEKALATLREEASDLLGKEAELVPFDIPDLSARPPGEWEEIAVRKVDLDLTEVTLAKALRYTCGVAQVGYEVKPDKITIYSPVPDSGNPTRVQQIDRYLMLIFQAERNSGKDLLIQAGIEFPEGSRMVVNDRAGQIIVRNFPEQHDRLDTFLISTHEHWAQYRKSKLSRRPQKTLQETVIPRIDFEGVPLGVALAFLEEYSLGLDESTGEVPGGAGVADALYLTTDWSSDKSEHTPISMQAEDIPLDEALREISLLAGYTFEVKANGVVVREKE